MSQETILPKVISLFFMLFTQLLKRKQQHL